METVDVQLVQKWIRQQIMFDQATVTYRDLATEAACGIDRARQLLEEFCGSEDAKRLKVEPTYLIFGADKKPVAESIKTSKVERARASELEEFKSKFDSVSYVQIYSISATQAPDPNLLKSYTEARISLQPKSNKKLTTESSAKESKATDSESSRKQAEPKSLGSKRNEADDAKKPASSKPNKRKESVDSVQEKPATTAKTTQTKLNAKKPTKASTDNNGNADSECEVLPTVPAKRPATEADHRKSSADKKSKTDSPRTTTAKEPSKKAKGDEEQQDEEVSTSKEPSERKRVTKTRLVKKKKIVRVKDKKGYRVNREEVEEVEETYTDWESASPPASPPPTSSKKNIKKVKMDTTPETSSKGDRNDAAKTDKGKTTTPADPAPASKPPSQSLPAAKNPPPNPPTKKKPGSTAKQQPKEQSNITSFFKKA
ncbi:hypothetical protein PtA15_8A96 [Puccinia triticina]|uniref:DNA polymerase delta subunit 3 n=1 Tax=Puccinia triticina TaxID=208348 RepID=A0ABY7CR85_9BASI|nr:uncharacterized protein PtA15_8A96 [Puccinia triticina]WAQ87195.1 hypothetical protein PtA15_8A96 [Puccinia triticina]